MSILILGSLAFLLFSLPVVTIPAAVAALFAAVGSLVRPAPGEVIGRFWRAFRRSLWPATLIGVLDLLLGFVLIFDLQFFWAMGNTVGRIASVFFGSLATVALLGNVFVWPLLAWYPQPVVSLLKRSFLLAAVHPILALAGLAGAGLSVLILFLLPGALQGLLLAIGPGLVATVVSLAAWKAMKRYAKPEDETEE